jgi:glycerol-3-phosphate dehydrogenase
MIQCDVCIVGSGVVGLLTALGLSRMGFNCILLEQGYPGSGASLNCAGVLHSGARYAVVDPELAERCFSSGQKLLEDYPFAIDSTKKAYYVGFSPEHYSYSKQLLDACASYNCSINYVAAEQLLAEEPKLSNAKFGLEVPDYIIDPAKLIISCLKHLKYLDTTVLCGVNIISLYHELSGWKLQVSDESQVFQINSKGLIIAAGSWSTHLLNIFLDVQLATRYINGSMIVFSKRLTNRVVSLCNTPSTGDTLVPCYGQTLAGSTWRAQESFAPTCVNQNDFDEAIEKASTLIRHQYMKYCSHSYSGVRSILMDSRDDFESVSRHFPRDFYIMSGKALCKFPNLVAVFGGKLTLSQNMASAAIASLLEQIGSKVTRPIDFSLSPTSNPLSTNLGSQDKSQIMADIY